jgi:endonuclease-8
MPEGDTIHKLAAALAPELCGCVVTDLRLRSERADAPIGHRISRLNSKGKHLFIEFDNGLVLRSHLGIYGSWHRYRPGEHWRKPAWQASIRLETNEWVYVCFNAREVEILRAAGYRLGDARRRLGPDLTRERPEPSLLHARARELLGPETPLVDVLLDQRVAAGIGNVYKSEVLYLERQAPLRPLGFSSVELLGELYARAGDLLRRNLHRGPRVTRFVGDGRGDLWVYGRARRPCFRCGEPVRLERLGRDLRSTYWCPHCQGKEEKRSRRIMVD